MIDLKVAFWDYRRNPDSLEQVLAKGYEYWEKLLKESFVDDFVILSTCNRLEVYSTSDLKFHDISDFSGSTVYSGIKAVEHLIRVSAGLESMSVGENDILRQIKQSYNLSLKKRLANKTTSIIFRKAISVGKLVREKTSISQGKVSIPALSVDILNSRVKIKGKKIAIIGTGKMACDIFKYVSKLEPNSVTFVGRNMESARSLAETNNTKYENLSNVSRIIDENDIIITATSSRMVLITNDMIREINSPKFMLDISNPKNIDVTDRSIENVEIITLSDIQPILERNRKTKEKEIVEVEKIVDKEIDSLHKKLRELYIEELISDLYRFSLKVKDEEVETLERAIRNGEDLDGAIRAMANSLVNKILSPQTLSLKQMAKDENEEMFDLISKHLYEVFHRKIISSLQKSEGREENQNPRDQTPQLDQKP